MAPISDQGESMPAVGGAPARPGLAMGPALPPLNVSGLVVARADLVAALRLYVPQLADITPLDSDRFLLSLAPATPPEDGRRS